MLDKIQLAFHEALGVPTTTVNLETSMKNMKEWDSLNHLNVIVKLEDKFKINFDPLDVIELNTVEKIITLLKNKGIK